MIGYWAELEELHLVQDVNREFLTSSKSFYAHMQIWASLLLRAPILVNDCHFVKINICIYHYPLHIYIYIYNENKFLLYDENDNILFYISGAAL